jgi:hypothetical protein
MTIHIDRSLRLPPSEYFPQPVHKTGIAIHHTVGRSARSTFEWWAKGRANGRPQLVGTAYLVDRDGTVFEVFDPSNWAYQFGLDWTPAARIAFEKRFIGIELARGDPRSSTGSQDLPEARRGAGRQGPSVVEGSTCAQIRIRVDQRFSTPGGVIIPDPLPSDPFPSAAGTSSVLIQPPAPVKRPVPPVIVQSPAALPSAKERVSTPAMSTASPLAPTRWTVASPDAEMGYPSGAMSTTQVENAAELASVSRRPRWVIMPLATAQLIGKNSDGGLPSELVHVRIPPAAATMWYVHVIGTMVDLLGVTCSGALLSHVGPVLPS